MKGKKRMQGFAAFHAISMGGTTIYKLLKSPYTPLLCIWELFVSDDLAPHFLFLLPPLS